MSNSSEYNKKYYEDNKKSIRNRQNEYFKKRPNRNIVCVYRWYDPDGICVYVGRGTLERAKDKKKKSWITPEHILIIEECENEWHAMEMEGKWGQIYQPIYNIDGNRR